MSIGFTGDRGTSNLISSFDQCESNFDDLFTDVNTIFVSCLLKVVRVLVSSVRRSKMCVCGSGMSVNKHLYISEQLPIPITYVQEIIPLFTSVVVGNSNSSCTNGGSGSRYRRCLF